MRKNEWTIEEKECVWNLRNMDFKTVRREFNKFEIMLHVPKYPPEFIPYEHRSDRAIRYALKKLDFMDYMNKNHGPNYIAKKETYNSTAKNTSAFNFCKPLADKLYAEQQGKGKMKAHKTEVETGASYLPQPDILLNPEDKRWPVPKKDGLYNGVTYLDFKKGDYPIIHNEIKIYCDRKPNYTIFPVDTLKLCYPDLKFETKPKTAIEVCHRIDPGDRYDIDATLTTLVKFALEFVAECKKYGIEL